MKKIRLRKWVRVVLLLIFWFSLFMLVCDHDNNFMLFIKTIICLITGGISGILLMSYGGYDER